MSRGCCSPPVRCLVALATAFTGAFAFSHFAHAVYFDTLTAVASHTCVVTASGGVRCWGLNDNGQLGDGTTTTQAGTVLVTGLPDRVTAVTMGDYHTCALTSHGGVACWGASADGQLGDGTTEQRTTPVDVQGLTGGVVAVSAGGRHTCAVLSGGGVKCWGRNTSGQLGDGTVEPRLTPVDVQGLTQGVTTVAAGGLRTCALTTAGGVKCWGYPIVGDGTMEERHAPVDVVGLVSGVTAVAAGGVHACAITTSGGVKCWGSNLDGELGDGTSSYRLTPVDVVGLDSRATVIVAGQRHTCAITTAGVRCWGFGLYGQVDNTYTLARVVPVAVTGLTGNVVALTAGRQHTCGMLVDGLVKCWGDDTFGELGVRPAQSVADEVAGLSHHASALAAGASSTCVITDTGGVKCWGYNPEDGGATPRALPVPVSGLTSGVTSVSTIGLTACAIVAGGVKCWGANESGQLGDGTTVGRSTPGDVTGLTSGVASVTVGFRHACALTTGGGVKCWGGNSDGQLGDGTWGSNRATPVDVQGLTTGVASVSAAGNYTCAVTTQGAAKCWGSNVYGQLGDGTQMPRRTPVAVVALTSGITRVVAGGSSVGAHACALTTSGGVKCWSYGFMGQLGDGMGANPGSFTPVDVVGLASGVTMIALGYGHTCAVTTAGAVKCWGANSYGQLGDGSTVSRLAPVDVVGLGTGFVAVAAGTSHTCALARDGGVKCWGANRGQLGYGAGVSTLLAVPDIPGVADFNADGKVDLVTGDGVTGDMVFWLMNGTSLSRDVRVAGPSDRNWQIAAAADFDLDGNADLLLHNAATGETQVWYLNGTAFVKALTLDRPNVNWTIGGVGDFNRDGVPDIVWHDRATGENAIWYMTGTGVGATDTVQGEADSNWTVVAVADLTGDSWPDLVWRNFSTGENRVWAMRRTSVTGQMALETLPGRPWTVVGTGDFNSDERTDLVWRSLSTGETSLWLMSGTTHASTVTLPRVPVSPRRWPGSNPVVGRAVVRTSKAAALQAPNVGAAKTTNRLAARDAPGASGNDDTGSKAFVSMTPPLAFLQDGAWQVAGEGDFNGDGGADILLRHERSGELVVWLVRDGQAIGAEPLAPSSVPDLAWHIDAVLDYDGDGEMDIVWRSEATGDLYVWLMAGTSRRTVSPADAERVSTLRKWSARR